MLLEFKEELDIRDLNRMSPTILMVMIEFWVWTKARQLPCTITSLMEPVKGRVSSSHKEGRSFDSSVRGWKKSDIRDLLEEFNHRFQNIAATSYSDNKKRLVLLHDAGSGKHLHWQVNRAYKSNFAQ